MILALPRYEQLAWPAEREALTSASRVFHSDPAHASFAWSGAVPLVAGELSATDLICIPMSGLDEAVRLVDRLLGPGGCPWDQQQTHESLKRHLLEEVYELLDAVDSGDSANLAEEVGDVLLQPIMHGQIAKDFDTQQAAYLLVDKLYSRHPHVFGDVIAKDAETVLKNWDQIKRSEGKDSILSGVPRAMPALLRAFEVSKRAARAGFEWPDVEGVFDKLAEEEAELREAIATGDKAHIASEVGDLLFTVVNLARWTGVEPEEALRQMVDRFTDRFQRMEKTTARPLSGLTADEWNELWIAAKND